MTPDSCPCGGVGDFDKWLAVKEEVSWQAVAGRVQQGLGVERFNVRAMGVLAEREGEPLVVACSGGADSVALLLSMWAQFPGARAQMVVAHFNHRLRGAAADEDEAFVRDLAAALELGYQCGVWLDAPEDPSESDAREARHGFLERVCREAGSRTLLTGHHQDDVGETVLMRVSRGSGVEGLAAPRPLARRRSGLTVLRPLIDISKAELLKVLQESGASWREDHTNQESLYLRNQLRNEVIPQLDEITGRSFSTAAARSRMLMEEVDDLVCELAAPLIEPQGPLKLELLRQAHCAVARRALELWLSRERVRGNLSAAAFDNLLGEVVAGRTGHCSAGAAQLRYDREQLRIQRLVEADAPYHLGAKLGTEVYFPWGAVLEMRRAPIDPESLEQILQGRAVTDHNQAFLAIPAQAMLTVRSWAAGDAYAPLGAPGRMKLKDQFINRKVPVAERGRLPVVCYGDSIVWCAGLPPAENFKLDKRTQEVGWLTYRIA